MQIHYTLVAHVIMSGDAQSHMVFSKSEIHQRKLRQSANDTNKHGIFAKFAHSGHSRSKNGGLSSDSEKTIPSPTGF